MSNVIAAITVFAVAFAAAHAFAQAPATRPSDAPLRIVTVGDSTMSNYPADRPDRGWGQFLEDRFKAGTVKVINLAAPGRSTKTFIKEGRWEKALAEKPDFVFIQFGHNDSHAPEKPESTDAATDYRDYLGRYIDEARAIGATPVLITPMVRRRFNDAGKIEEPTDRSLASYAAATKDVGREKGVAVIDLHASSKALAEKLGPKESETFANKKGDVTHFNEKGARAMADLVTQDLAKVDSKLGALLKTP